jgi:hypothetical protein
MTAAAFVAAYTKGGGELDVELRDGQKEKRVLEGVRPLDLAVAAQLWVGAARPRTVFGHEVEQS